MKASSLGPRAFLALLSMLVFYALALGIIGLLVYIPYAEWVHVHHFQARLAIACLGGATVIAFAVLPRFDRFEQPGPTLDRASFPRLFQCIDEIAHRTGQIMPTQVFLVSDLRAFVANRGGVLGLGSRRVMGLGLPLMQVLSPAQFEAVLAHEFGHYYRGGATRLGPWIYETRGALGRALEQLGNKGALRLPFRWYASMFLRLTHAISRAQEHAADQLAASVVGGRALIDGLKRMHAAAPAFDAYWSQEVAPVLDGGFSAPLSGGFGAFLIVPHVKQAMDRMLDGALKQVATDPDDSHPALPDRIAAVKDLASDAAPDDGERAIELLGDVELAERRLLAFMGGTDLTPLCWPEVAERVFLPRWRERAGDTAAVLEGTRLVDLPDAIQAHRQALVRAHLPNPATPVPVELENELIAGALGGAIAATLVDAGWSLLADVGQPVSVQRGELRLEPFELCRRIGDRAAFSQRLWREALETAGIDALPLRVAAWSRASEPGRISR